MKKVVVTTDSGICPIDETNMIPGQIIDSNDYCYRDVLEISNSEILKSQKTFKTSSPLQSDYEKEFIKHLEQKENIIHLSMSSGISEGSVNLANLVANELNSEYENKIRVIDTLTGATGGTLINEVASNLANKQEMDIDDMVYLLNQFKYRIKTSFYVPDPTGFIRSGRNKSEICVKDKALLIGLKTALKVGLKFRVDFNSEGNLYTNRILQGSVNGEMLKFIKNIVNEQNKYTFDANYVVIGNLLKERVDMERVKDYLYSLNYFNNIIEKDINGVVAAYGCPDLCGISLVKHR